VPRYFGVSWQEVPKHLHQDSRYREVRNPDIGDVALKGQTREYIGVSANRDSGVGEPSWLTSRVSKLR
jgi:hypothetical protein